MTPISYWQFDCNGSSNSHQISAKIIVSSSPTAVEQDLASPDSILRENVSLVSEDKIETLLGRDPFQVQVMLACFCAQITLMDHYENWACAALPAPTPSSPPNRPPDDNFDCGVEAWILSAEVATNRLPQTTAAQRSVLSQ